MPEPITTPGLYDLTPEQYHRDPVPGGSLSQSRAKTLLREAGPARFRHYEAIPETKPEWDMGTVAHAIVLCKGSERLRLIDAKDDARKAQVAELHREAQPIGRAAPLPDDGEVAFAERVVTDQLILGVRQRQQAFALGGGEDRTAGHAVSFFLKT
mgnify:CR=1 FL=1